MMNSARSPVRATAAETPATSVTPTSVIDALPDLAELVPPRDRAAYRLDDSTGGWMHPGERVRPADGAVEPSRVEGSARLRGVLASFLNLEWPTRAGALVYPLVKSVRASCREEAEECVKRLPSGSFDAPVQTVDDLARALGRGYAAERRRPEPVDRTTRRSLVVRSLQANPPTGREREFEQMCAAFRRVDERCGVRTILHGSLATGDSTGYSDADLLLLLPGALCCDAERLQELRRALVPALRAMWCFDPLQHHGIFLLPESELGAYPEHYLPLAALADAAVLTDGELPLECHPYFDARAARTELRWAIQRVRRAWLDGKGFRDAYELKAYASVLMLVPALYCAAVGRPCAKRDSFAAVVRVLPPAYWEPQPWAARLREQWRAPQPAIAGALARCFANPRAGALAVRSLCRVPSGSLPSDLDALLWSAHVHATVLGRLADLTRGTA